MKILLIGHGRMGHLMERTALAQGDQLGGIVDVGNLGDLETIGRVADVAIDFSAPAALPAVARYVNCPCRHELPGWGIGMQRDRPEQGIFWGL